MLIEILYTIITLKISSNILTKNQEYGSGTGSLAQSIDDISQKITGIECKGLGKSIIQASKELNSEGMNREDMLAAKILKALFDLINNGQIPQNTDKEIRQLIENCGPPPPDQTDSTAQKTPAPSL